MTTLLKSFWVTAPPCDDADGGCSLEALSATSARLELTSRMKVLIDAPEKKAALYIGGWRVVDPSNQRCLNGILHTLRMEVGPSEDLSAGSDSLYHQMQGSMPI